MLVNVLQTLAPRNGCQCQLQGVSAGLSSGPNETMLPDVIEHDLDVQGVAWNIGTDQHQADRARIACRSRSEQRRPAGLQVDITMSLEVCLKSGRVPRVQGSKGPRVQGSKGPRENVRFGTRYLCGQTILAERPLCPSGQNTVVWHRRAL